MNSKKWIMIFFTLSFLIIIIPFIFVSSFTESVIKKSFEYSDTYSDGKWVVDKKLYPTYVFMGSSMSRHSIMPSILEKNLNLNNGAIVNIGMNAATPYEMYLSYKKSKQNYKNVKTFFYTLEPWIFQKSYYVHKKYEKLLWNYSDWTQFSTKHNINNNYYNKINLLFNMYSSSNSTISEDYGYSRLECKKFDTYSKEQLKETFSDNININYGISEFQLEYLKKLKLEIESQKSNFVIMYVPNHYSYYNNNIEYNEKFNNKLSKMLNNYIGKIKFIGSFNPTKFNLLDEDFMDTHHLCHRGAMKFSEHISNEIHNINQISQAEIKLFK